MATTKLQSLTAQPVKNNSNGSNSTVGINVAGIQKMKAALADYQKEVKSKVSQKIGASQQNMQKAIKGGTSVNTLKNLTNELGLKFGSYMNQLNKYGEILSELESKYRTNDTENTTFVNLKNSINK